MSLPACSPGLLGRGGPLHLAGHSQTPLVLSHATSSFPCRDFSWPCSIALPMERYVSGATLQVPVRRGLASCCPQRFLWLCDGGWCVVTGANRHCDLPSRESRKQPRWPGEGVGMRQRVSEPSPNPAGDTRRALSVPDGPA